MEAGEFYAIIASDDVSLFYWGAFGKEDMLRRLSDMKERGTDVQEIFNCGSYASAASAAEDYISRRKLIPPEVFF